METLNHLSEHRIRSIRAILADGWQLYAHHFWTLVRASWIQAIAYALLLGFAMTTFFTGLLPCLLTHASLSPEVFIFTGSLLAFVVVLLLFAFAGGLVPLRQHWLTGTISRPRHWWGQWPWRLTLRGLRALPRMLVQCFRRHQAGALLVTLLVMFMLVLVATIFFQMPAIILSAANIEGQSSLAAGDAADLPSNLWLLNFATFSFCGFLQAYIHLATLFPLYYIWRNTQVN